MPGQLTLARGFSIPQRGKEVEDSEAGITLYRILGRMGILAGKLAPMGDSGYWITRLSDPLVSPR